MAKQPEAQSKLHLRGAGAGCGRFEAAGVYEREEFEAAGYGGASSNFAKPEWQTTVKGSLELKQISVLADVDGLNAGARRSGCEGAQLHDAAGGGAEAPTVLATQPSAADGEAADVRCRQILIAWLDIWWWARRRFARRRTK